MHYLASFIAAFALTATIEGIVIYVWYRQAQYVYYTFLCNLLTNPALNLLLLLAVWQLGGNAYLPMLMVAEAAVVFIEAAVLRVLMATSYKHAFGVSLVLNLSSIAVGMLFRALIAGAS